MSHQPSRSPPWGNLGFGSVIIPSLLLLVATGGLRLRFHLLRTALRHSRSAWVHRQGAALREVRPECIGEVCYYWWPREASACGSTFSDEPCGTRGVRGYIGGARRSGKSAQNASAKFAIIGGHGRPPFAVPPSPISPAALAECVGTSAGRGAQGSPPRMHRRSLLLLVATGGLRLRFHLLR